MNDKFDLTPELEAIVRAAFEQYRHLVTGAVYGIKYKDGKPQGLSLRFHVKEKVSEAQLGKEKILPKGFGPLPTDVVESPMDFTIGRVSGQVPKGQTVRDLRVNPIQPGISVSHGGQGAGTLGLIVYLEATGAPAILSCAHVLSHQRARKGDLIFQPSPVDGGDQRFDVVGHLEDWFIDADGDAGIALLTKARMVKLTQLDTEHVINQVRTVRGNDILSKSGRGTGVTHAKVDGIGRFQVRLGEGAPLEIEGFTLQSVNGDKISDFGDSGAVWYSLESGGVISGVGLHVDGDPNLDGPRNAIACHLPRVMSRLKVALVQPRSADRPAVPPSLEREPSYDVSFGHWVQANRTRTLEELLGIRNGSGNGGEPYPGNGGAPGADQEAPLAVVQAAKAKRARNGQSTSLAPSRGK